jgi:NADH-quinone oxidoreductase subunit A
VNDYLSQYLPLVVTLAVCGGFAGLMLVLAAILGPKARTAVKAAPFECGSDPIGDARGRFAVKFYVVAILFIVFDLETVFLYPWAVEFKSLGWVGFGEMVVFAATLVVGLVYVWKKGALEWEH